MVTDEVVERAAYALEKKIKQSSYGWTDEQFEIWWNDDPYFISRETSWGDDFGRGTPKNYLLWQARTMLEAALNLGKPVSYTTQTQLDKAKESPGHNTLMWGEPLPYHPDIPLYLHPAPEGLATPTPSAVEALQAIADLPTPENSERMGGHEDAYRAIERLFASPPHIEVSPSPQTNLVGIPPASDNQIGLMKSFWDHYGTPPHVRELNASLLKKDFLSLISRIARLEADNLRMLKALEEIASLTQTESLLWWQVKAREAAGFVGPSPAPKAVWQPMETAPKDGRHSIFAVKCGPFVYSIQGTWDSLGKKWINAADRHGEYLAWMPNVMLPDEFCPWTDEYKARNEMPPLTDPRPRACRFRLKDGGLPYPKSSCTECGRTVMTGLGNSCHLTEKTDG